MIAVMPYRKHQDFRDYYRTVSLATIRRYLYCLFSALQDTHAKGIIHRDIKPANFLFDVNTKVGVLCDFGLAEQFQCNDWHGKCLHSLPEPKLNDFHGKLLTRPKSTHEQKLEQWKRWKIKMQKCKSNFIHRLGRPIESPSEFAESPEFQNLYSKRPFDQEPDEDQLTNPQSDEWYQAWKPNLKIGGLWGGAIGKRRPLQTSNLSDSATLSHVTERVGFKRDDARPGAKANRAGTRGFRAPEVLLKCPDQTGGKCNRSSCNSTRENNAADVLPFYYLFCLPAIDIWSVGITLLCFLTRRFPFFNSNDDTDALMEISTIFGRQKLEKSAALHSKSFSDLADTFPFFC